MLNNCQNFLFYDFLPVVAEFQYTTIPVNDLLFGFFQFWFLSIPLRELEHWLFPGSKPSTHPVMIIATSPFATLWVLVVFRNAHQPPKLLRIFIVPIKRLLATFNRGSRLQSMKSPSRAEAANHSVEADMQLNNTPIPTGIRDAGPSPAQHRFSYFPSLLLFISKGLLQGLLTNSGMWLLYPDTDHYEGTNLLHRMQCIYGGSSLEHIPGVVLVLLISGWVWEL